jgi:hypothetical protein
MSNPCIETHAPHLKDRFNELVKGGMSEREAGRKAATEDFAKLHKDLITFKESIGIKLSKEQKADYIAPDNSAKIKEITDAYENKIKALGKNAQDAPKVVNNTNIGSKAYKENAPMRKSGRTITKTVPDGSKIKGTYKLVSSDDVIASHNESTFSQTEGFPTTENGKTVNDRDYQTDKNAQAEVSKIAQNMDDRAISQTPIVTKDGIVVDGNNRTMSRKLAAKLGTDKAYIDALKDQSELYGFSPEDVDAVNNPMLVFEAEGDIPYTTKEFARFNKSEKKEKGAIEKAVELSKTMSDRGKRVLASIYENAERPSDVSSNKGLVNDIKKLLLEEGIIQSNELPRFFNPTTGTLSKDGVAFVETMLIGSALKEDTIRALDSEGMGNARTAVMGSIVELTKNSSLGEDSLIDNVQNGVVLLNTAKNGNMSVVDTVTQLDMFKLSEYSPEDVAVAVLLESGGLKKFLKTYNESVGTESIFDGKLTKESIIDNLLKQKIANYEKIRPNLRKSATKGEGDIRKNDGGNKPKTGERKEQSTADVIKQHGSTAESRGATVQEIKSKNLTHVKGLNMGSNQVEGTYLSTEDQNRYEGEGTVTYSAEVNISSPFVSDQNTLAAIQQAAVEEHFPGSTLDDLSETESNTLSKEITKSLKDAGYDSLYFPESKGQEGELIVFDRKNVTLTEVKTKEQIQKDEELIKEYTDATITDSESTTTTEGKGLEEGKTKETERSGPIGALRDKVDGLKDVNDKGERDRLAREVIEEAEAQIEALSEEGESKKKRRFAEQVQNDPDISDEIKKGMSEEGRTYIPITNALTVKEATAIIELKGVEQSTEDFLNFNNGMHPAVRTVIGELLIRKYNQLASDVNLKSDKGRNIDQAIKVADALSIHLTGLGQAIQAASVFSRLSPEGIIRVIQREFKKVKDKKLAELSDDIKNTEDGIEKINKESIDEVLNGKLKDVITEKSKTTLNKKRKESVKKAIDFLESIKIKAKPGTLNMAAPVAIPVATYNAAITTIQLSLKAGDMVATAIEKAIKHIKASHKDFDEAAFRNDMSEKLSGYDEVIDPSKIVKNAIKDLDINVSELIKKHYTEVDATKKSLTDKLIKESGLTEQEAIELSKEIQREFDKIATKKKREFLNSKIKSTERALQPKQAAKKKQLFEKITELSNARTLSHKEFEELYADYFDVPKLTEKQVDKITELSDKIHNAKGQEAHGKAVQDLLKFQESIKGFDFGDMAMSIWYSNILSGLSTQTMNISANFMETAGEAYTSMVQNPRRAPSLMKALFKGYGQGLLMAKDVLSSGYTPTKGVKIDVQGALERYNLPGGAWNPYNYLKYVGRVMSAADIFAYAGLKEMRSQQLATSMAIKEGKSSPTQSIEKRANEILFNTSERVAQAEVKATEEGLKGEDKQRRVFELIEESRPQEIVEDAKDFASEGTFNYDPVGLLGAATQGLNHMINMTSIKGVKPLSFVVPFTRIIANVTNRYLDWTPWGLVRAAKGGVGYRVPIYGDRFAKKYTPEERQREFIKAVSGTAAMAAIFAMTEPDDEDKSEIQITADGTGDYKKNYELQETGWRPYSVKIGDKWYEYKNTPLAIPFAMVGQIRDAQRYKGDKDLSEKVSIMASGTAKYIMDMSFMSSLSDFFTALGKSHDEGAGFIDKTSKSAARVAKSFVVPNLFTQLSRSYQETMDMPMKQAKTVLEEIRRDMPYLRDNLNNMYNTLGETIYPDQNRKYLPFRVSAEDSDKVWNLISNNQAWVGMPSKNQIVYDAALKGERKMTEEEFNEFAILAGKKTKEKILKNYDFLMRSSPGKVQDEIKAYKEKARKSAKYAIMHKKK